jgi:hypothetical protein
MEWGQPGAAIPVLERLGATLESRAPQYPQEEEEGEGNTGMGTWSHNCAPP